MFNFQRGEMMRCKICDNYDGAPDSHCQQNEICDSYKPECGNCQGKGYELLCEDPEGSPEREKCGHCEGSGIDEVKRLQPKIEKAWGALEELQKEYKSHTGIRYVWFR